MIPVINNILYTTDLSSNARFAFGYAAALSHAHGAKITILHVVETLSDSAQQRVLNVLGEARWQDIRERNRQELIDTIHTRLDRFCQDMQAEMESCPFLVAQIEILPGQPAEQILTYSQNGGFDLIVMGTHGQGAFADAMMGSTARRVVRRSEIPVLVIRLPETP